MLFQQNSLVKLLKTILFNAKILVMNKNLILQSILDAMKIIKVKEILMYLLEQI